MGNCSSWAKCRPLPSFLKILIEHSHIHLFVNSYFCNTTTEVSSCNRAFVACNTKSIYCLAFYSENLPTPAFKKKSGLYQYLINYSIPLKNRWRLIKKIDMTDYSFISILLFIFLLGCYLSSNCDMII